MKKLPFVLFVVLVVVQVCRADDREHEEARADEVAVAVLRTKRQVFFGGGFLRPSPQNKQGMATTAGFAMIIPLSKETFIRPFVAYGLNSSAQTGSSPVIQSGALFGYKVTPKVSMLGGGGMDFIFPHGSNPSEKIPVATVATMMKLDSRWVALFPVGFSRRGTTIGFQLVYAW